MSTWTDLRDELARSKSLDDARRIVDEMHDAYLAAPSPLGGVTPGGLPYPSPTDPVAEGADAIRALAEAVDAGRALFYRFTPVTMTLPTGSGIVPGSAFTMSLKAGQSVVFRTTANLNNSVSGGARVATLRQLKNAGVFGGSLNGVYAIPWVTGSTTTTCVLLNAYTAAVDETFEMTLTAWANTANAVTFQNMEWEVIATVPGVMSKPGDKPEDELTPLPA
jgi:hypothetical protein